MIQLTALAALAPLASGRLIAAGAPATFADDIAILRELLTKLHPGLYRYLSPRAADAGMTAFESAYVGATDQATRYLALSRFLSTIRCGHSYANFYNQSRVVKADLFDRKTRLPFAFRWIGRRMIVTADHGSGESFLPGTEIRKINGIRARDILAGLMPYVRADGHNDAKRTALLSVTGADEFETFDIFHGLLFGEPAGGRYRLEIAEPNGPRRTIAVPAISLANRQKYRSTPAVKSDEPLWQWEMRPDGIAVLTMNSWGTYNSKWDWKSWLSQRLNSLTGARGLIVDIRKNEGGEDCGDEIIARFARTSVPLDEQRRLVRFRTTPKALDPYLDTWDDSFRKLGDDAEAYDDLYFRLRRGEADQMIKARGPHIDIPLIALIGPQNSSATFQFASRCQKAGLATLIGEPTGGNQRGINGGAFFFVRLPASGLEFDLPLIGFFPAKPAQDAGVVPDVIVRQTAQDITENRDAAMEAAIARLA